MISVIFVCYLVPSDSTITTTGLILEGESKVLDEGSFSLENNSNHEDLLSSEIIIGTIGRTFLFTVTLHANSSSAVHFSFSGYPNNWFEGEKEYFPAEIIATDYNLMKRSAATSGTDTSNNISAPTTGRRIIEDEFTSMENVTKILAGERIGLSEYTAQRKDGSTFPIMIQSTPIVRGGKTLGLRGFIIDITNRKRDEEERRKLEAQFHQAQRLETIGTLAGGIAHDFNNLMTTILGNTSLMLYDKDPSHPHYELLKNIDSASENH